MRRWTGRMALGAGVTLAALLGATTGWSQNDQNAMNGQQTASRTIQMVPAKAELQKGLNAKKLKPGDTVTAKLVDTVNLPNEPALKRNTVLLGRVDEVDPSQHHGNSQVTVTFNQAKMKDGTVLPVKVTVMQLMANSPEVEDGLGGPGGGPATEPSGVPGPGTASGRTSPSGVGGGAKMDENSTPLSTPAPAPGGVGSQNGVPGVMLRSDIHQSSSATFMATGRNVNVPSGTQMQVEIAAMPKDAGAQ